MKAGSFDIMDAESANKKARRASLIKTVVIVILAIAVVILGIKATIDANNSGASDENEANEDHGHHRPLVPDANVRDRNKRQVCYTSECIKKSASLFESMNMKADPCEDFHEYACGNFVSNARIPDDKGRWTNFGVISEKIYERGRTILEQGINDGDWETFKMAKRHYKACMDEEKREELGVKPMKEYLDVFGGWPVLLGEAWTKTAEWYETIFKFNEAGFGKDYLVSVSVSADDKNSSWRKIYLDKPSLGMSREYLIKGFEDKDVRSYFTYMKEAAVLYGADEAKADEEMKPVLDLEIKLAKATLSREKRRNSTLLYNPYILGEYKVLEGHPPSWADYIDKILFGQFGISNEETVIIQDVNYLKEMSKIVQETSPRTLANYLAWRAVSSTMTSLNKAAKEISLKYNKARTGKATSSPKWKTCVHSAGFNSYTDSSLRIPASSMYIREHFTPEAKSSMIDMIKYVRSGFEKVLKDIDWMDDVTKGRAEEKLRKMKQMIAYPEEMLDQTLVDDFHKDLVIKEDDYAGNILRLVASGQ